MFSWKTTAAAAVFLVVVAVVAWFVFSKEDKPEFDGERAFQDLVAQVDIGPRIPETETHRLARQMIVDTLRKYADRVGEQPFTFADPRDTTKTYEGINVTASFNVQQRQRIMLAAHYDTRPFADQEPDSARRSLPVPGANDGASGVAVLLEMARLLHAQPSPVGVDLVFFDMEDMGDEATDDTTIGMPFAVGSEYFAATSGDYRPAYGIVVDMVCDRDLRIPKEANSVAGARWLVNKVWAAADEVGAEAFVNETGMAVYDDHVAFLQRGIPVIDLIHTPFPSYWHTTADTPEQCSPSSLQQVGDVLVEVVYEE